MDITGADFYRVVNMMKERLKCNAIPVQLPIGAENTFKGIVDLVEMKAYIYYDEIGKDIRYEEIPADMLDKAQQYHEALVEAVAEQDDALLEKYFSGEPLGIDEIKACIRKPLSAQNGAVAAGLPRNKGVQNCWAIVDYLPAPTDIPSIRGDPNRQGD